MNKIIYTVCSLLLAFGLNAAAQLNLPIRNIGGKDYYYRQVKKKETIYGISKELGITKDNIVKYNPSVASGLKKDQILYFPVSVFGEKSADGITSRPTTHKHTVESGETLYGISKMYGISVSSLVEANDGTRNGLKAGMVLTIPIGDSPAVNAHGTPYTVKPGDTLYRLSVNNNVELSDLLAANPGVTPETFKAGMTILIPPSDGNAEHTPDTVFILDEVGKDDSFESISAEYAVPEEKLREANPGQDKLRRGDFVAIPVTTENDSIRREKEREAFELLRDTSTLTSINLTLLLPLQAESTSPEKQALLHREFYRGFLLAVNDSKLDTDKRINISVFDTDETNINDMLRKDEVADATMIFAPGEESLLRSIAKFGKEHDINVASPFSINNEMYYDNDRFIQVNTPSSYMYSSVQDYITKQFSDYEIVFLKDSTTEDKPLVEYLNLSSLPKRTVSVNDTTEFRCERKTLFIPTSSNRTTLKAVEAFFKRMEESTGDNAPHALFGYPEWTIYHEHATFLKRQHAYFFSRFVIDKDEKIEAQYKYWYGEAPINSVPQMFLLGYDTAKYFIAAISGNGSDLTGTLPESVGSQIAISLRRSSSWGGFVNTASFIYQYSENGFEKVTIQ